MGNSGNILMELHNNLIVELRPFPYQSMIAVHDIDKAKCGFIDHP